jgi:hypothetical protein
MILLVQMEVPELYPAATPAESHFLRRYHTYLLSPPSGEPRPPPASVLHWMEEQYQARVTQPVSRFMVQVQVHGRPMEQHDRCFSDAGDQQHQQHQVGISPCCPYGTALRSCLHRLHNCVLRHLMRLESALRSQW